MADVQVVITERRILRSDRPAEEARVDDAIAVTAEQRERLHRQLEGTDGTAHDLNEEEVRDLLRARLSGRFSAEIEGIVSGLEGA